MKSFIKVMGIVAIALGLGIIALGSKVEVPPAHIGKIMSKDGYQEAVIPTSKFRLSPCWAYCDRLVLMDVSDKAYSEALSIFIPNDKLNIAVNVRTTLSLNPQKSEELFNAIAPKQSDNGDSMIIENNTIYSTYASQIVQAETREYMSQFTIAQIASSIEKMNSELRERITKRLQERTPYNVRYVGITGIKFPDIITQAQENAAERREKIEQENAQLQVSQVALERQLQEAQLTRKIEEEKAKTEAIAQQMLAATVDDRVLKLRALENERLWIEKWKGHVPSTVLGDQGYMINLSK